MPRSASAVASSAMTARWASDGSWRTLSSPPEDMSLGASPDRGALVGCHRCRLQSSSTAGRRGARARRTRPVLVDWTDETRSWVRIVPALCSPVAMPVALGASPREGTRATPSPECQHPGTGGWRSRPTHAAILRSSDGGSAFTRWATPASGLLSTWPQPAPATSLSMARGQPAESTPARRAGDPGEQGVMESRRCGSDCGNGEPTGEPVVRGAGETDPRPH